MSQRSILLITREPDIHADAVESVLRRDYDAEVFRFDMGTFSSESTASVRSQGGTHSSRIVSPAGIVDLEAISSVWWRRPSATQLRNVYRGVSRSFVQAEFDHFVEGTLWSTRALWVNDPVQGRKAARKVVQLRCARESGFKLPATLMSNIADDVRAFAKAVGGPLVVKRIGTGPGPASKTTLVESESIEGIIDELLPTPAIFQEYIPPGADLRTIWVNGQHWTVRIDSAAGATPEDCRYDHLVPYTRADLPIETQVSLRQLMSRLGLAYGAIDFRVDPEGQIYFLEVNPGGQFLYLQTRVDIPLVEALAELLALGER